MFGHRQRTSLPVTSSQFEQISFQEAASSKDSVYQKRKQAHDQHRKTLPPFKPGQQVLLQDNQSKRWTKTGFVVSVRPDGLSYLVSCDGRPYLRSRFMLRPSQVSGGVSTAASNKTSVEMQTPSFFPEELQLTSGDLYTYRQHGEIG